MQRQHRARGEEDELFAFHDLTSEMTQEFSFKLR